MAENDFHAVLPGSYVDNVWILGNRIHSMAGDGVQVGQATFTEDQRPNFVYIGGNSFHDNRENAVDVKRSNDVVINGNDCYGFFESTSSAGEAIVIHNEAARVWVVGNRVHDSNLGIITTGSTGTNFIGNTIYNITYRSTFNGTSTYSPGAAIHVRGTTDGTNVVGNTIDNCAIGIQVPIDVVHLVNNIFSNRSEPAGRDVNYGNSSGAAASTMENNFFYGGANPVKIAWGESTERNLAGFRAAFPSKGVNCPPEGNPLYANRPAHDYRLLPGSPATDRGALHPAYAAYRSRYGVSILEDMDRIPRPQGASLDIGAYEYGSVVGSPPPPSPSAVPKAPTGLRIQ